MPHEVTAGPGLYAHVMPIHEFECGECGNRFEELLPSEAPAPKCPACGAGGSRRLMSPVSPPSRLPRGAKMRDGESRRREREAARSERLADTKKKRAAGEIPQKRSGGST